jgi:hypothetical protein
MIKKMMKMKEIKEEEKYSPNVPVTMSVAKRQDEHFTSGLKAAKREIWPPTPRNQQELPQLNEKRRKITYKTQWCQYCH